MKVKTLFVVIVTTVMMLLTSATAVSAPIATAEATIDWNSFKVTSIPSGLGPAPVFNWTNQSSTVNGFSPDQVSVADWTSPIEKNVGNLASFSNSIVNASTLHSYSEDSDLGVNSTGSTSSLRQGEFSILGSGSLRFSLNYNWKVTLLPANNSPFSNFATALGWIEAVTRDNIRGVSERGDFAEFNVQKLGNFTSDIGVFQGQGTIEINVPVVDGDHFYFTATAGTVANVSDASVVPLPTSAWLFISSLIFIIAGTRSLEWLKYANFKI